MHPRSELVAWSTHPVSRAVPPTYLLAATWPSVVCDEWAGLRGRCRRCEGQTRSEIIIRGSGQRAGQWMNLDIIFFLLYRTSSVQIEYLHSSCKVRAKLPV